MTNGTDDILRRVANGELTPADALVALDETAAGTAPAAHPPTDDESSAPWPETAPGAEAGDPAFPPYVAPEGRPEPDEDEDGHEGEGEGEHEGEEPRTGTPTSLRVVQIRTSGRTVDVIADPAVSEAYVEGSAYDLRRTGDALVLGPARSRRGPAEGSRFTFVGPRVRYRASLDNRLVVRVNPELRLDVDGRAVTLRVWGCAAGLRLRLSASTVRLQRIEGAVDARLVSSTMKGTLLLQGDNSLDCQSSTVKLGLLAGSDVQIDVRNHAGRVVLPTGPVRPGSSSGHRGVVGAGHGRLAVDATASTVVIGADR